MSPVRPLVLLLVCLPLLASCSQGGTLSAVSLSPTSITPDGRAANRVATLRYALSRRADVTISFTGPDGATRTLRDARTRSAGDYTLLFDGTYGGHVLPDGAYRWQVVASDPTSRAVLDRREASLTIAGADTTPPRIDEARVFPPNFHPNGNLGTDTSTFTYLLSKPARVTISAVGPRGSGSQRYDVLYEDSEQPGPNQATWTGKVSPELFVPDGIYDWTIEARDAAGNVESARGTVEVSQSGIPDARIEDVRATEVDQNGERLVQIQVRFYNYGHATLYGDQQSGAPQDGFTYGSLEANYAQPAPFGPGWADQAIGRAGTYTVGVGYFERSESVPPPLPFRWSIGGPVRPRETRVVTGYIKVPPGFHGQLTIYAGLVHEGEGILSGQYQIPADRTLVLP